MKPLCRLDGQQGDLVGILSQVTTDGDDDLRALIDPSLVTAHRQRSLSPERPFIRGTAQNPDVYFQMREAANAIHGRVPAVVEAAMARFAERTGRQYRLVEYHGAPDADRVIVVNPVTPVPGVGKVSPNSFLEGGDRNARYQQPDQGRRFAQEPQPQPQPLAEPVA